MSITLVAASTLSLLTFTALAFVDGVYLHLWRYRLHLRPESRREHWLHTARALLFPGILATLFLASPRGATLWLGVALVAVDQVVEFWDTFSERNSRASLGGLSSFEYTLHVMLTTVRVAAITLALAVVPAEGWSTWAALPQAHPALVRAAVEMLLPGAVLMAGVHVWLGCRGTVAGACVGARA